jgi:hypothetical protein
VEEIEVVIPAGVEGTVVPTTALDEAPRAYGAEEPVRVPSCPELDSQDGKTRTRLLLVSERKQLPVLSVVMAQGELRLDAVVPLAPLVPIVASAVAPNWKS